MGNEDIRITIITVSYNSIETIEQTISSVVNQTYSNIEYIIVDGASTDGTVDVIKKYGEKISRWISENDTGIYNAMNKAVEISTGDYIQIIGSDDCLVHKNIIEEMVGYLDESVDILSGNVWVVDSRYNRQFLLTNHRARDKSTYIGGMIPHGGMFVRRSLYIKYPFDESYKICADYKFFLQCYYNCEINISYIDIPVLFFELNGTSNNREVADIEDNRIHKELHLPFHSPVLQKNVKENRLKEIIKEILRFIKIWRYIEEVRYKYFRLKKHRCENIICRWCGRLKPKN